MAKKQSKEQQQAVVDPDAHLWAHCGYEVKEHHKNFFRILAKLQASIEARKYDGIEFLGIDDDVLLAEVRRRGYDAVKRSESNE